MSILEYFELNKHPFRIGPNSCFLYFSDQVKETIAKCECMARERIGLIYMYGAIGSGKTSILRRLHERLSQDKRYQVAYIISPQHQDFKRGMRLVMESFEVKTERSYNRSLKNLETYLVANYKEGKIPLLLVDEAQNMNRDTLKLLHYLRNYETATTKLLQVVLVGQENLATQILRYRELASRMFPISINTMSAEQLEEMIRFRWLVAGGKALPFAQNDKGVFRVLFAYTRGVPRDAVKMCDEVLRDLFAKNSRIANVSEIEHIARELNLKQ